MARRSTPAPSLRISTLREEIRKVLLAAPATARDLSKQVGIPERDVAGHLEHLARSAKHRNETLVIEAAACLDCGFAFTRRARYTRPGHCPDCRSRRISLPRFRIEPRARGGGRRAARSESPER